MAEQTRTTLKAYFETGDTPTESQFADLIDSDSNILDDGKIPEEKWYITTDIAFEDSSSNVLDADPGYFFAITDFFTITTVDASTGDSAMILKHNSIDLGENQLYIHDTVGGFSNMTIYTQYGFTLDLTYPIILEPQFPDGGSGRCVAYLKGIKYL